MWNTTTICYCFFFFFFFSTEQKFPNIFHLYFEIFLYTYFNSADQKPLWCSRWKKSERIKISLPRMHCYVLNAFFRHQQSSFLFSFHPPSCCAATVQRCELSGSEKDGIKTEVSPHCIWSIFCFCFVFLYNRLVERKACYHQR